MKKLILLIILFLGAKSFAQTKGITYQAVILNPSGEQLPGVNNINSPMVDKNICLQFRFIDEFSTIEYQETVETKTDQFGMVNLIIGSGNQTAGYAASFEAMEWNALKKSLIVSINTDGSCSSFTEISDQPFTAVPFAFSAINAGNVTGVVDIQNGGTNAITVVGAKTNLGLENVDNTSDLDKPMSIVAEAGWNINASGISAEAATARAAELLLTNDLTTEVARATTAEVANVKAIAKEATNRTSADLLKEDLANKSTNVTTDGTSDTKYPSVKSVKTYVDASSTTSSTALTAEILRATTAETANATAIATETTNRTAADATLATNLATEVTNRTSADLLKEDLANKSTNVTTDGTSDTKYPSVKSVKTYVDASSTTSSAALTAEISRATTAETANANAITTETTNRTAADATLATTLATEASTARAAETANATAIDTETTNRTAADATLAITLATEASTARAAETANATAITTETTNRTAADATLATNLATEVTNRTSADLLKEDLANKSTNVTTDGTSDTKYPSVKSVKTYVDASSTTSSAALTAEISRATTAETANAIAIATETTNRTAADATLATNLATEASTARAAETVNATAIATETTNRTAADAALTTNLATEVTNRTSADLLKEDLANKSTNVTTDGTSDTKYPSVKSVKTYVDNANTTNANLTGPITSVGNATAIASQTGTGSTFVMSTSPTIGGTTTLSSAIINSTLNVSGTTTLQSTLSVAGATALSSTLSVAGVTTFNGNVIGIDKTEVGLGNVDNTTDLLKPVSTATQTALNLKANLASPTITGTPTAPTAAVGTNTFQLATTAFVTAANATNANLTGMVTSVGNATTVVTNANLTGPITSSGNTTSVASQTGTGSKFVMDTAPTLVTPVLGVATATSINGTAVPTAKTLVVTTDKLNVLAATTSAELAGVISDETGTGSLVLSASPTFTGTPLAPTATPGTNTTQLATTAFVAAANATNANLTGMVTSNGNATTVVTNANLTGPITSSGNTTSVASQTGTGSKFVMDTAPTLVTPVLGVATATSVNGTAIPISKTLVVTTDKLSVLSATTSTEFAGVISDETGTGSLVLSTSPTLVTPVLGVASATSVNGTTIPSSKILVVTTDKLNVLAATTSSELAGVISDETGTGTLVLSASPTFTGTPTLPTGTIGVTQTAGNNTTALATTAFVTAANATNANLTGMVTSVGNAATVVTNANLTGPITSSGNTTSVASQTGTGSKFVMDTAPTLVTPVLGVATATSVNGTAVPTSKTLVVTTDKLNVLAATTSAELAGVISDETGTGSLVLSTSPTLVTPVLGVATATSINGTAVPSSKTLVVTTDKLNVLAATTSSELAGVISDETGTGSLVLSASPTFTGTPTLPTGTIGVTQTAGNNTTALATTTFVTAANATNANLTGMVTSVGNAATVVTNANLTGPITSSGNTTSVASQTGTGSKFVMDTAPTLVTPVLGVASATSVNGTTIPSSKTLVVTTDKLNVLAATTSSELAGVISAETGTGSLVLSASPTFTGTPTLPTGTIGVTQTAGNNTTALATTTFVTAANATNANLTGMVTSVGNAATVVTNANLTGPITSSGNTTSVASQTGTGSKFVMDTAPTLVTPVLGVATATSVNGTTIPTSKTLVVTTDKLSVLSATTSTELAGVISDETGTGSLVLSTSPTLVTPVLGVASATSVNGTTIPSSKTLVVTTDKLNVLAATTSAELAGVISDETGIGSLVLSASPTFTGTPTLPTGTIGVTQTAGNNTTALATTAFVTAANATNANLTGMVTSVGNATTVVTNANLTGPITSSGNTTSVASQTGTGSKFVMDTAPTLVTPVLGVATATSVNGTTIPTSKTLVVTTDKLSVLSATTSTELAGVISDETGTGSLVLSTSPTLVTPVLGVATATSINGTAVPSSKTLVVTTDKLNVLAATTSSELAGVISDETGTGSLVLSASPTFTGTPTLPTGTIGVTQTAGNNTTALATTAFVTTAIATETTNRTTVDATLQTNINILSGTVSTNLSNTNTAIDALETLADGKIYLGNGSNVATEVAMTGDVTITNAGVSTIGSSKIVSSMIADATIVDADINANAAIVDTKLAAISTAGKVSNSATTATTATTANTIVLRDGSGNFTATNVSGVVAVANGGTGSVTQNFVDLTTTQTVAGTKKFSNDLIVSGLTVGTGLGNITSNTALGNLALQSNTTGFHNIGLGSQALMSNTSGARNTALGSNTLYYNDAYDNTAIGYLTLKNNTSGSYNAGIGSQALFSNTTGNNNSALGSSALKSNTVGSNNTAMGINSLNKNTSGSGNTAAGGESLLFNTTGTYNVGYGVQSLEQNTTGNQNTAIGVAAIDRNTTGTSNTVLGAFAGRYISDGSTYNTLINRSVLIGAETKPLADNDSNEIVIGFQSKGNGSNTVQLGNTAITNVKTSGTITAGTVNYPNTHNATAGQVLTTNVSGVASWEMPSTTATAYSGVLPVANGGTGSSTVSGAKTTLGLQNVDNTSDTSKPVSTAGQTALNLKSNSASPTFTGAVTIPTLVAGTNTYPTTQGLSGQVLVTSGTPGTIVWGAPAAAVRELADEYTSTTGVGAEVLVVDKKTFTLTQVPSGNSKVKMYINGIRISNTAYSTSTNTLTYIPANNANKAMAANDRVLFDYFY